MTAKISGSFSGASMHVLFVIPRFVAPGQFYQYSIGLASVYAFIRRYGVSVSCLNLNHESDNTYELLDRECAKRKVDMVCTGGMSMYWGEIEDVLVNTKRINRDLVTVVGGPIITADPELAMTHLPIDYGVIGEGEYTLIELLETLQRRGMPDTVKGLTFRNPDGQLVITEKREEIKNLDALPIPEYEAFGFREGMGYFKYAQQLLTLETFSEVRFAEIIGSRSCPFSCTFCYHPLGKTYRQRSLDHIFSEIDYLHKNFGVNVIAFNDELLSINESRLLDLAERIRPYNIKWTACFRVNDVRLDLMKKLAEAGLMFANFGIESINDDVLKSMKKHISKAKIVNALEVCREARLECSGNIILGDPAETTETANESITWWKENPVYHVSMGFIRAVPDAPIYRFALEKGLVKNKLTHVRNLPLINMSKMADKQYYNLVLKVWWWNLMNTYAIPGTFISTHRLDECYGNKHFYKLHVRCPFCGSEQIHKKFLASSAPNVIISCSQCFAYFKIPQKQAFPSDYSSKATVKNIVIKLAEAYSMRFFFIRNYRHVLKKLLKKLIY